MTDQTPTISAYRIGWWSGPRIAQLVRLARILITGRQPGAICEPYTRAVRARIRRGMVRAIWSELRRPWRLHRPWQAEHRDAEINARRAFTARAACAKVGGDLFRHWRSESQGARP